MPNPFDKAISFIHRHRPEEPFRFAVPYLLVVVTILLGVNLYEVATTRDYTQELRDGLVASCEDNGNPLRRAVRNLLEDQIDRSEKAEPSFFPNIPPDLFKELVEGQIDAAEETKAELRHVDCAAQYP